jgi:hypothetical protein
MISRLEVSVITVRVTVLGINAPSLIAFSGRSRIFLVFQARNAGIVWFLIYQFKNEQRIVCDEFEVFIYTQLNS